MEELIKNISELNKFIQLIVILSGNFISEDLTLITSFKAYFSKQIKAEIIFPGLFIGILLSDLMVYYIGKLAASGRKKFLGINLEKARVKSEKYKNSGILFLVASRFMPGVRFLSLFAMGVVRFPIFLFIIARSFSIILLFFIIILFENIFISYFYQLDIYITLIAILSLIASYFLFILVRDFINGGNLVSIIKYKLLSYQHYEFWNPWFFYIPMIGIWLYLAIKYRDFVAPVYANPGIEKSGLINESKEEIFKKIPDYIEEKLKYFALDCEEIEQRKKQFQEQIKYKNINYPIILKPDVGQRGIGVFKADCFQEVETYLSKNKNRLIIQEYCHLPKEAGIFYIREKGKKPYIFSITIKKFPTVTGNGKSTLSKLILKDKRARYIYSTYAKKLKDRLNTIPLEGEKVRLVNLGNHSQGAIFENGNNLVTDELLKKIDSISKNIKGFYAGRYDVRFESDSELQQSRNFKIVELNGAGAEATHIYSSDQSLLQAYKTLFKQWDIIFRLGKQNKKKFSKKISLKNLILDILEYRKSTANYN